MLRFRYRNFHEISLILLGYIYTKGSCNYSGKHVSGGVLEIKVSNLRVTFSHNNENFGSSITLEPGTYYPGVCIGADGIIKIEGGSNIEFNLNDSITSFKVWVEAVSVNSTNCVLFAATSDK